MENFDLQRLIIDLGLKNFEFAERIGKTPQGISNVITSGKLPKTWIQVIKNEFPEIHLGDYLNEYLQNSTSKLLNDEVETSEKYRAHNVLHVPIHAEAGFVGGENIAIFSEDLEPWYYPGLKGKCFSFVVKGDSMVPTLDPGDIIVANQVPVGNIVEIQNNFMYAITMNSGQILVKRVIVASGKAGLILRSDNSIYDDQELKFIDNHLKLYKVRRIGKWNASMRLK